MWRLHVVYQFKWISTTLEVFYFTSAKILMPNINEENTEVDW